MVDAPVRGGEMLLVRCNDCSGVLWPWFWFWVDLLMENEDGSLPSVTRVSFEDGYGIAWTYVGTPMSGSTPHSSDC